MKETNTFLNRQKVKASRDWVRKLKFFERALFSLGIVFLGLAALYGLHQVVFMSSAFAINNITVDGSLRYATANGITELSGVKKGDNLFWVSVSDVRDRVRMNQWVKSAAVRRMLPDTLCIYVEEYAPVALALSNGELYFVDANARPFKRVESDDEKDFPVLTGLEIDDGGNFFGEDKERAATMLALISEYEKGRFGTERGAAEVSHDKADGYSLITLHKPVQILFGHSAFGEKLSLIDRMLEAISSRPGRIQYILANEAGRLIVKYAS